MQRLQPLAQRLAVDFSGSHRFDNPRAPQVRLQNFDLSRLEAVGRKIRDLYAEGAAARGRVLERADDEYLSRLARAVTGGLGGRVGIAPRVFLKKLVQDLLDRIDLHPDFDRGWHLLAVLERVRRLAGREIQRLGLSATIGNPEALLEWLVPESSRPRRVVAPGGDAVRPATAQLDHVGSVRNAAKVVSALHRGEKRLVFCDSRAGVEALAAELHRSGTRTFVSHSSLALDERRRSEEAFSAAARGSQPRSRLPGAPAVRRCRRRRGV